MFEARLYTAEPDRQRLQRLTLAAAIAIAATSTALASVWTLDRLHIDRITGPTQQFELAHLSLLPPPKPVTPPPPPELVEQTGGVINQSGGTIDREQSKPLDIEEPSDSVLDRIPARNEAARNEATSKRGSIPDLGGGLGCPASVCTQTQTGPGNGPGCVGPHCVGKQAGVGDQSAPTEVEFSALRCLACADPDRAALRKTTASVQGRQGRVVARFCVDVRGRVDSSSVKIERSFGDAAVDRITRSAIEKWRFSPMKVGNQPRRACSRAEFHIKFD